MSRAKVTRKTKKCTVCGVVMENAHVARKYCPECARAVETAKKRENRAQRERRKLVKASTATFDRMKQLEEKLKRKYGGVWTYGRVQVWLTEHSEDELEEEG